MSQEYIELQGDEQEVPEAPEDEEQADESEAEREEVSDDLPDVLLSEDQLAERTAKRERAAEDERIARSQADRDAVSEGLREFLTQIKSSQPAQPAQPQVQQQQQPQGMSAERAAELTQQILTDPGGIAKALERAIMIGRRMATEDIRSSPEGQAALQSSAEVFADKFKASKLRDPDEKFARQIERHFDDVIEGYELSDVARMPKVDRDRWFEERWEIAAGRLMRQKGRIAQPPSLGVGRGSGGRQGPPQNRVRIKMTEAEKKSIYRSLPNTDEGRKMAERQIAEIEFGRTSSPTVARAVAESIRFSDAVRQGGA